MDKMANPGIWDVCYNGRAFRWRVILRAQPTTAHPMKSSAWVSMEVVSSNESIDCTSTVGRCRRQLWFQVAGIKIRVNWPIGWNQPGIIRLAHIPKMLVGVNFHKMLLSVHELETNFRICSGEMI
jgi:hypothetical protein